LLFDVIFCNVLPRKICPQLVKVLKVFFQVFVNLEGLRIKSRGYESFLTSQQLLSYVLP